MDEDNECSNGAEGAEGAEGAGTIAECNMSEED
jgi:hypothetical protein